MRLFSLDTKKVKFVLPNFLIFAPPAEDFRDAFESPRVPLVIPILSLQVGGRLTCCTIYVLRRPYTCKFLLIMTLHQM